MVPNVQSVAPGTEVRFIVKATRDDRDFQWKKDSIELDDDSKYHGTKTDTLRITDVEKSDEGIYQCLVKNDVNEVLSEKAELAVSKFKYYRTHSTLGPPFLSIRFSYKYGGGGGL